MVITTTILGDENFLFFLCAQIPLAIMVLLSADLQADRLYSKSPLTWQLVTTTAGYFLYDLYVHTVRYEYTANLVHAAAALSVFLTGIYCGVLHYYGEQSPRMMHDYCGSIAHPWRAEVVDASASALLL